MIQDVHPYVTVNFPEYIDGKAVAEPTHYLKLMKADSEKYKAKIVAWSDAKDLAILKLSYVPEGVHAVPLAKESAKSGHEVHSIGNPGGSPFLWIYTSGKVRTADAYHTRFPTGGSGNPPLYFFVDAWVIQTQSPTNPGDSGGPMVNDRGELVAVTQSISGQSANTINNFIDIREVRALLKTNNLHWIEK
jgi:S1-C subfamily serine protease